MGPCSEEINGNFQQHFLFYVPIVSKDYFNWCCLFKGSSRMCKHMWNSSGLLMAS